MILLFICFVISNTLLILPNVPAHTKVWIIGAGLILPWSFLFLGQFLTPSDRSNPVPKPLDDFSIKPGSPLEPSERLLFFILVPLGLLIRWALTFHGRIVPAGDEAMNGILSLGLTHDWNWDFFYSCGQLAPLWNWMLAGLFNVMSDTRTALWTLPFIFSAASWWIGTWAAYRMLSPTTARWTSVGLAMGVWPVEAGMYCHQGALVPFWFAAAMWIWGRMLHSNGAALRRNGFWFGLWVGLGTLSFTNWLAAIPFFTLTVVYLYRRASQKGAALLLHFMAGLGLGLTPFAFNAFREGYGRHLSALSLLGNPVDQAQQWVTSLSYVTVLLWGSLTGSASYGPLSGGFLNPVAGSAFLVGLAVLFRHLNAPGPRWLLAALFFFMLPGLLARDYVETYRIILAMPILVVLSAIGFNRLHSYLPGGTRKGVVFALVLASCLWDVGRIAATVQGRPRSGEVPAGSNDRIILALQDRYEQDGPGLIFADFLPLEYGHMVSVSSYPWNAALNKRWSEHEPNWVGVVIPADYQVYLQARFPGGEWCRFPSDGPEYALGLISLDAGTASVWGHWKKAHWFFHEQNIRAEQAQATAEHFEEAKEHLLSGRPLVAGDPFLESAYGEWASQFYWDPRQEGNIRFLQAALRSGYPAVRLKQKLRTLLREEGRHEEADRISREPSNTGDPE